MRGSHANYLLLSPQCTINPVDAFPWIYLQFPLDSPLFFVLEPSVSLYCNATPLNSYTFLASSIIVGRISLVIYFKKLFLKQADLPVLKGGENVSYYMAPSHVLNNLNQNELSKGPHVFSAIVFPFKKGRNIGHCSKEKLSYLFPDRILCKLIRPASAPQTFLAADWRVVEMIEIPRFLSKSVYITVESQ